MPRLPPDLLPQLRLVCPAAVPAQLQPNRGYYWLAKGVARASSAAWATAGSVARSAGGPRGEAAAGHILAGRRAEARLPPPPVTLIKGGAPPCHGGQFVQRGTLGLQAGGRYLAGQLRGAPAHQGAGLSTHRAAAPPQVARAAGGAILGAVGCLLQV